MRQNKGSRNHKSDYGLYWQAEIENIKNGSEGSPSEFFVCGRPLANQRGERYFDLLAKRTIFILAFCAILPIDIFPKL